MRKKNVCCPEVTLNLKGIPKDLNEKDFERVRVQSSDEVNVMILVEMAQLVYPDSIDSKDSFHEKRKLNPNRLTSIGPKMNLSVQTFQSCNVVCSSKQQDKKPKKPKNLKFFLKKT